MSARGKRRMFLVAIFFQLMFIIMMLGITIAAIVFRPI